MKDAKRDDYNLAGAGCKYVVLDRKDGGIWLVPVPDPQHTKEVEYYESGMIKRIVFDYTPKPA